MYEALYWTLRQDMALPLPMKGDRCVKYAQRQGLNRNSLGPED